MADDAAAAALQAYKSRQAQTAYERNQPAGRGKRTGDPVYPYKEPSGITGAALDVLPEVAGEYGTAWEGVKGGAEAVTHFGEPGQELKLPSWMPDFLKGPKVGSAARIAGGVASGAYAASGLAPFVVGATKSLYGHGSEYFGRDYEKAKGDVDIAAMGAGAGGLLRRAVRGRQLARAGKEGSIAAKATDPETGITAPQEGIPKTQRDPAGREHIKEFEQTTEQQRRRFEEDFGQSFSPSGRPMPTPYEAGTTVQRELRGAAATAKRDEAQAWRDFRRLGGKAEIAPEALEDFGQRIQSQVTDIRGVDPHTIDPGLTPVADGMLKTINATMEQLKIDAGVAKQGGSVLGFNFLQVQRLKSRLIKDMADIPPVGIGHNSGRDMRASQAILQAFDREIDRLVDSKSFSGDKSVVAAWNFARDRTNKFKSTFEDRGTVAETVNQIIRGRKGSAMIPNDVADWFIGNGKAAGLNPASYKVGVANHIKSILGENSEGWAQAKQIVWQTMLGRQAGSTKLGDAAKLPDQIRKFFDEEMSKTMFNGSERDVALKYANVLEKLGIERLEQSAGGLEKGINAIDSALRHRWLYAITYVTLGGFGGIGHMLGSGTAAAGAAGMAGGLTALGAARKMFDVKNMNQLRRALPILSKAIERYDSAVTRARSGKIADRAAAYTAAYEANKLFAQHTGINPGPIQPPDRGNGGPVDKLGVPRPQMGGPQQ